jgi:hypothetical protein
MRRRSRTPGAATWLAVVLAVVVALAVTATVVTTGGHDEPAAMPPVASPPDSIVCEGRSVDADCVQGAATRAGRTIAWLRDLGAPSDRRLFVAPRLDGTSGRLPAGGIVYETALDGVDLDLESAPASSGPGDRRRAGTARGGGIRADVWRSDDGASTRLEWRRADQAYRLEAFRPPTGDAAADVAEVLEQALAAISYVPALRG